MSRYERRNFFDRLCTLRVAAPPPPHDDRTSVMTIEEAIEWAEARFDEAGPVEAETSDATAEGTGDKADRAA